MALWPAHLDALHYVAMGMMVLVGACLQGVSGLGFAMFSAPMAALLFPALVPGPLLALGCPLALMTMVRERTAIDWTTAKVALVGRAGGTMLAAVVVAMAAPRTLALWFGALILAGVGLSLAGWNVRPSRGNVALAGVASGVMGTITSAGAPPFAIAMQTMQPATLRATLGCVFTLGAAFSVAMLAAVGRFTLVDLVLSVVLLPWVIAGFGVSGCVNRRLPGLALRPVLLAFAAFGALAVLARNWP